MSSAADSSSADHPASAAAGSKMDTHKLIKKQITYSEGLQTNFFHNNDNTTLITTASMIAHTNEYNNSSSPAGKEKASGPPSQVGNHARMANRTNSFSNQLMPNQDHNHHHHSQEQAGSKLYSTCSVIESDPDLYHGHHDNKLHRSKEIENLHDEQLEYSLEEKKSEIERNDLLHHKSHIMRTAEVENLNELANDD